MRICRVINTMKARGCFYPLPCIELCWIDGFSFSISFLQGSFYSEDN